MTRQVLAHSKARRMAARFRDYFEELGEARDCIRQVQAMERSLLRAWDGGKFTAADASRIVSECGVSGGRVDEAVESCMMMKGAVAAGNGDEARVLVQRQRDALSAWMGYLEWYRKYNMARYGRLGTGSQRRVKAAMYDMDAGTRQGVLEF